MVVGAWQLATTLILQEGAMNGHKDENAKHLHEKNKNRSTIVAERERELRVLECQNHNPDK